MDDELRWFREVYRKDERQLTVRAVIAGMAIGALMCISNLYVVLKTGWSFGVTITACIVAFALFFTTFSTFLGKPGLYLEDLFVLPEMRGFGVGRALMQHLAQLCVERDYGRFEWSVLDWNAPAIGFYQQLGATLLPDWRRCRLTGPELLRAAKR